MQQQGIKIDLLRGKTELMQEKKMMKCKRRVTNLKINLRKSLKRWWRDKDKNNRLDK